MDKINELPQEGNEHSGTSEDNKGNVFESSHQEVDHDKFPGTKEQLKQLKQLISEELKDRFWRDDATASKEIDPQVLAERKARSQAIIVKALGESKRDTSWEQLSGWEQLKVLCSATKDTLLLHE